MTNTNMHEGTDTQNQTTNRTPEDAPTQNQGDSAKRQSENASRESADSGTQNGTGSGLGPLGFSSLQFDHVVALLIIGGILFVARMSPVAIGPFPKLVIASLLVVILVVVYSKRADAIEGATPLDALVDEFTDVVAVLAVLGVAIGMESVPDIVIYAIVSIALGKRAFGG